MAYVCLLDIADTYIGSENCSDCSRSHGHRYTFASSGMHYFDHLWLTWKKTCNNHNQNPFAKTIIAWSQQLVNKHDVQLTIGILNPYVCNFASGSRLGHFVPNKFTNKLIVIWVVDRIFETRSQFDEVYLLSTAFSSVTQQHSRLGASFNQN